MFRPVKSDLISTHKSLRHALNLTTLLLLAFLLSACSSEDGGRHEASAVENDVHAPSISLVGESEVTLLQDQPYSDAGALASDDVDGDLTTNLDIINLVNPSKVGRYTVTYRVSDAAGNAAVPVSRTVNVVQTGKAQLGPLVGATAEIFLINDDGSLSLLFTETTTDGDIISAGQFDFHYSELEENKWYLAKVTGGEDIDANDDGVMDSTPTPNLGSIHLVFQKDWLKSDKVIVTAVSEVVYQFVKRKLDNQAALKDSVMASISTLVDTDINGDGRIDEVDVSLHGNTSFPQSALLGRQC